MDALKFAFEILIVGALALPWLAILIRMLSPEEEMGTLQAFIAVAPAQAHDAVAVAITIAVGYLAGSAVSRVSRDFFNDELWGSLPTEQQIRSGVYYDEYCKQHVLAFLDAPTEFTGNDHPRLPAWLCDQARDAPVGKRIHAMIYPNDSADMFRWGDLVDEMFQLQEGALLLRGEDKVDRLKQYYDQISVLRGAALNGVILFAVCTFGICASARARLSARRVWKEVTFIPALILSVIGAWSLATHWQNKSERLYTDPPLAELVLLLLGVAGIFIVIRAREAKYLPTWAMAAALTAVSFGGWWWTEVMYNIQVIHSVPELALQAPDRAP